MKIVVGATKLPRHSVAAQLYERNNSSTYCLTKHCRFRLHESLGILEILSAHPALKGQLGL